MEGPFRSAPTEGGGGALRDDGIVGDVIRQFADPLAFYRELIQNSIDAGTPSVEVRLEHDPGEQLLRASVRDQGDGMDRDILENQLLVLFRSTKERDPTKIGKFGIGFKSVLAPGPRAVVVATSRAGKKLTLHLYPDLRYELFDTGPSRTTGTTVTVELPMEAARVDAFVRDSHTALVRWCRHASVPIHFVGPGVEARIDRPLDLEDALIAVRGTSEDGQTTAVVGYRAGDEPYAGFFNHGLMLYETAEELGGRVAFKVQDSRLGHTLSRDNVRRDAAFDRAVAFVRDLEARELLPAMTRELAAAAERDLPRYAALLAVVARGQLPLAADTWVVPLVEPLAARTTTTLVELGPRVLGASRWSPLVGAFTAQGTPVLDLSAAGPDRAEWLRARIDEVCGRRPVEIENDYTLVTPVALSPVDASLLEETGAMLDAAHRRPASIVLAELDGALAGALAITGEGIVHVEQARRSPFGLLARRPLVLGARHPVVAAARVQASANVVAAASLLARAVLLHHGAFGISRSERLLARTLERLGAP